MSRIDKLDPGLELEILEKLEMLEEIEQLSQKTIEIDKKLYNIPPEENTTPEPLIFSDLISIQNIIKRDQEEIQYILVYNKFRNIIMAEIPPYRRDREYRITVENLELSPELPEELRKKITSKIEISVNHNAMNLKIPCRKPPPNNIILQIRDGVIIDNNLVRHIIRITLREILWIALTLSDKDIERVAREIMKHSKEDALLFAVLGAIAKQARKLLLSNPNLIKEAIKRRAEIEMKREKELEELAGKQNIPLAWIPSDRARTLRRALKDLRWGEDPEKVLKRKIEGFKLRIPLKIIVNTEERRYKPFSMGKKEEAEDQEQKVFNQIAFYYYGIELLHEDNHETPVAIWQALIKDMLKNPVAIWRSEMTIKDMLDLLTNITKKDIENCATAMKNILRKAEVVAEYIERLRIYASEILNLYRYRREELEKGIEKTSRAILL